VEKRRFIFWFSDVENYYRFRLTTREGTIAKEAFLEKVIGGIVTIIDHRYVEYDLSNGILLRLPVENSNVRCYINHDLIFVVSLENSRPSKVGLWAGNYAIYEVKEFKVLSYSGEMIPA